MDLNAVQHSHGFSRAEPLCQRLLIQTSGFQAGRGYHCVPVHRGGGRACCKKERPDDGGRVGGHGRASGLTTAFQGHRRHGSRAPPWITTAFQGHRHRITSPTTAQDGTPGAALPMDHEPQHGSRRHSRGRHHGSRRHDDHDVTASRNDLRWWPMVRCDEVHQAEHQAVGLARPGYGRLHFVPLRPWRKLQLARLVRAGWRENNLHLARGTTT